MAAQTDTGGIRFVAHRGTSMLPVLRPSDLLELEPSQPAHSPVPGDIVLFDAPDSGVATVHRVVSVAAGGLRTRGDNSRCSDPWIVPVESIKGSIRAVWRNGVRVPLECRLAPWKVRLRFHTRQTARFLLWPARLGYRLLAHSGAIRYLCPKSILPQPVAFAESGRPSYMLVSAGRRVGQFDHSSGTWHIDAPYRLLVDERRLPCYRADDLRGIDAAISVHDRVLCRWLNLSSPVRVDLVAGWSDDSWAALANRATGADLASLLYKRVCSGSVEVPQTIRERLRHEHLRNAARTVAVEQNLSGALRALRAEGIDTIALKGADLAWAYYPGPSSRPIADVDLLLHRPDIPRAREVLRAQGDGRLGLPDFDLHWTIGVHEYGPARALEDLWVRSVPCTIAGVETSRLDPLDCVVMLSLHLAANHVFGMGALKSLCDVCLVVERNPDVMDAHELAERASAWRATNSVWVSMELVGRLFESPRCASIAQELRPADANDGRITESCRRLFAEGQSVSMQLSPEFWSVLFGATLRARARALQALLFPSKHRLLNDFAQGNHADSLPACAGRRNQRIGCYIDAAVGLVCGNADVREAFRQERLNTALRAWLRSS